MCVLATSGSATQLDARLVQARLKELKQGLNTVRDRLLQYILKADVFLLGTA